MSEPRAAVGVADADELWEGLLFCEDVEEAEFTQGGCDSSNGDDDAPKAPGTTCDGDVELLKSAMHDLFNGDPEASKVRQCIQQLQSDAACKDADLRQFGTALADAFPDATVHLREATNQRATCLHRLRHKSLVLCPTQPPAGDVYRNSQEDALIIDLSFRESFSVPNPSPRYQSILDLLPDVFVAPTPTFTAAVEFLAEEMGDSFKFQQMHIPPWRTAPALLSKWSPDTTTDTPLPCAHTPPPPAPQHPPVPAPTTPQRPPPRPATQRWPSPMRATKPPTCPAYKAVGIKELLDVPVYPPRRTRRRPRPSATKPTTPSSSPPAPPAKLRAILSGTPTSYTPSQPVPCKAGPPCKAPPPAAASPSSAPIKRPFTTTVGTPTPEQSCKA